MPIQISISNAIKGQAPSGGGSSFLNEYSFEFDGNTDYIEIADADNLSFGNGTTDSAFSISLWIKLSGTTFIEAPISKYGTDGLREYMIYIVNQKVRLLIIDADTTAVRLVETNNAISVGSWVHITTTYNGVGGNNAQNGMKIYINGILASTNSITSGTYVAMENTSQPVEIGRYFNGVQYLAGNTDEVAIFDVELSASDVTSIYNGGVPNDLSSLSPISWWRMGEGATWDGIRDWTLRDAGSGGNDGTSQNMAEDAKTTDVPT